jgi:hypothetical protein
MNLSAGETSRPAKKGNCRGDSRVPEQEDCDPELAFAQLIGLSLTDLALLDDAVVADAVEHLIPACQSVHDRVWNDKADNSTENLSCR